ncbi:MAG TPA: serine protease inhibitor ecotin [Chitinophaga sp.]|uniref:serine protease inhibitor ecotin n=1 Tax=Chitinophaga sp. TaxID=1869181 RepID=UPI002C8767FC|nr:serine protease inhibitor ecotin [Chitinophaga sp.]HVI47202.1 serine protease inhibitor ecotin [Chitinophaga sp.]
MKKIITILTVLLVAATSSFAQNSEKELKAFPAAKKGFKRYVIQLENKADENNYQVEILAGKKMKVDCNNHGLIGKYNTRDVKGWGYTYYEYISNGLTRSTLMACPDKQLVEKFIAEPKLVRYNSKLPVVVYVPDGFEVRYKIWERQDKEAMAEVK